MIAFDYVINLIESLTFMLLVYLCCKKNRGLLPLILATIVKTLIITMQNYFLLPEFLFVISGLTVIFLYATYINPYKRIQNCFLALTSHILSISSATLGMIITKLLFGFPFYEGTSYIFLLLSTKALFILSVLIASHYLKNFHFLESKKYIFIFISMISIEFLFSILIDGVFYNEVFGITQILSFLTINILFICFYILLFQFQNEQEYILQLQKDKLLLENEENIQKINKQNMDILLRWKHDMKHIFSSIDYSLLNKDIDGARSIVSKQQDILNESQFIVHSGNQLIDYLISQRHDMIVDKHIYVSIDYDGSDIPLKDIHFLIIVGNVLDNAIENCESEEQRVVKLSVGTRAGYFYIKVENTIVESVLVNNPDLKTNKDDKEVHGIVLKNVRLLVKQYHGDMRICEDNCYFVIRIVI